MSDLIGTALSGWFTALIFVAGLALPYLLRRFGGAGRPYLRRLWPYFWIGYLLPVVAFLNAWIPMTHGSVHGLNMAGLWLATITSILMIWQFGLGLWLQSPALSDRRTLRKTHFWTMALMAGLIVAYIAPTGRRRRPRMKNIYVAVALLATAAAASAATVPADFSGKWKFDAAQSKNVGMMSEGAITTVITESKAQVVVDDTSVFNGQTGQQHTVYDLTGKPTANTLMMAGPATARSHWDGARLVTEWESAGAIAGTTVKRTETRYLSADGGTMYVESARPGTEPLVMVFIRER